MLPAKLRPASANQPLGPRWPATPGLVLDTGAHVGCDARLDTDGEHDGLGGELQGEARQGTERREHYRAAEVVRDPVLASGADAAGQHVPYVRVHTD
eukprot:scaffold137539_cov118-Phaeocystis_antarctica.AAC.1